MAKKSLRDHYKFLRTDHDLLDTACELFARNPPNVKKVNALFENLLKPLNTHLMDHRYDADYCPSFYRFCYSLSRLADATSNAEKYELYRWYYKRASDLEHENSIWRDQDNLPLEAPIMPDDANKLPPSTTVNNRVTKAPAKRGRRAQNKADNNAVPNQIDPPDNTTETTPAKRGPGRPRKNPIGKSVASQSKRKNLIPPDHHENAPQPYNINSTSNTNAPSEGSSHKLPSTHPGPQAKIVEIIDSDDSDIYLPNKQPIKIGPPSKNKRVEREHSPLPLTAQQKGKKRALSTDNQADVNGHEINEKTSPPAPPIFKRFKQSAPTSESRENDTEDKILRTGEHPSNIEYHTPAASSSSTSEKTNGEPVENSVDLLKSALACFLQLHQPN